VNASGGTGPPGPSPLDRSYLRKVERGLDRAFAAADELELDSERESIVIFSDHHRGARDGADDFLRCEPAYCAALGYYLEAGYRLVMLGDVEELWENDPGPALAAYRSTLDLEAAFHRAGRYYRFWGNHDDLWADASAVDHHLGELFPGLLVRESLKLRLARAESPPTFFFLVHGHQGTDESDRFAWFSRIVVRVVWRRIQRKAGLTGNTPAKDFELRARHDRAMFEWARTRSPRVILIAGHTHRPVFWTSTPPPPKVRDRGVIEQELREREADGDRAGVASLRAELEFANAEEREPKRALALNPPCYFNTGCSSFGDGDVTGLEISGGEIRLVRWPDDEGRPRAKVLASEPLTSVLREAAEPSRPAQATEIAV
jgi:UDP-2,3-diacylglucosamine pyrophosphatase LpxH